MDCWKSYKISHNFKRGCVKTPSFFLLYQQFLLLIQQKIKID